MIDIEKFLMPDTINIYSEPLVFDDSETYLEQITKVYKKLNDTISLFNQIQLNDTEYTDSKFLELQNELHELINKTKALAQEKNNELEKILRAYNDETNGTTENRLNIKIDKQDNEIKIDTDKKYNELKYLIEKNNQGVIDVCTGKLTTVQNALNSIYDMLRSNALTCSELDAILLTATAFDNKHITASQFDINNNSLKK